MSDLPSKIARAFDAARKRGEPYEFICAKCAYIQYLGCPDSCQWCGQPRTEAQDPAGLPDIKEALAEACRPNWTQQDIDDGLVKLCPAGCIPGHGYPGCPCPFGCDGTGLIEDYREEAQCG